MQQTNGNLGDAQRCILRAFEPNRSGPNQARERDGTFLFVHQIRYTTNARLLQSPVRCAETERSPWPFRHTKRLARSNIYPTIPKGVLPGGRFWTFL